MDKELNDVCPTCGAVPKLKKSKFAGLGVKQLELLKHLAKGDPKTIPRIYSELNISAATCRNRVNALMTRGLVRRDLVEGTIRTYMYSVTKEGVLASKIRRSRESKDDLVGLGRKQKEVISYLNREGTVSTNEISEDLDYVKGTMNARLNRLVEKRLVVKARVGGQATCVYHLTKKGSIVASEIRQQRIRRLRGEG